MVGSRSRSVEVQADRPGLPGDELLHLVIVQLRLLLPGPVHPDEAVVDDEENAEVDEEEAGDDKVVRVGAVLHGGPVNDAEDGARDLEINVNTEKEPTKAKVM